jgi:SAM-dependent methyltransferase
VRVTKDGTRFEFGANWARFLRRLDARRIELARTSLTNMLKANDLRQKRFLDIGSGSGLFSLAARQLGATVFSFDYDAASVACTAELRRRYFPDDPKWIVERGSVLDEAYVRSLGTFDVVYSWGVLHHTGNMWRALELATVPVAPEGLLCISIYNRLSPLRHRLISRLKETYVRGPAPVRWALVAGYATYAGFLETLATMLRGENPLRGFRDYAASSRGMSWWTDAVDWMGGFPYEAATPSEVFEFFQTRGFVLMRLTTQRGHGCNEFVFVRPSVLGRANNSPSLALLFS